MYIPEFQDVDDVEYIYSYSKIPVIKGYHESITHKEMSDVEHYFACFSLCVLFPLLYGMLISADRSVVMILYRFIRSGLFNTVSYIKEFMTNLYYIALRMFGQYSYSTYTVVRSGREIYSASSIFFIIKVMSIRYIVSTAQSIMYVSGLISNANFTETITTKNQKSMKRITQFTTSFFIR